MIVRLNQNYSYVIIREEKEVVRLGESVFQKGFFDDDTLKRVIFVCKKFVEVAKGFGSVKINAVATSAAREAANHMIFIHRLASEADLYVRIISGKEEARLIYLGLSSGVEIKNKIAIFIDIGGGSTEIILGDQQNYFDLDSLGLGAIRLTELFLVDKGVKPVSKEVYEQMRRYVQKKMLRVTERINQKSIELAFGSSGTIINLAEIANKYFDHESDRIVLTSKELSKIIDVLCDLPLEKRKQIPGINPDRADIIIGGAVILDVFMQEFKQIEIQISPRGLRHGLLIDYLQHQSGYPQLRKVSVREDSVFHLARLFNVNLHHAQTVKTLAFQLFDSAKKCSLHEFGEREKELLGYAALLHDIGNFISFRGHHLHSYYIVSNAELLGFDQSEITIMAGIVRFHRKKLPKGKEPIFSELDMKGIKQVVILSLLLRCAEKLDRSHAGYVKKVEFKNHDSKSVDLLLDCSGQSCELERWGVDNDRKLFESVFEKKLQVLVR